MNASPNERIERINESIDRKKDGIKFWIGVIGAIFVGTLLAGAGLGLITDKMIKCIALGIGSGALLSVTPVMKISDLVSAIDVDKRVIETLNHKKKKTDGTSNAEVKGETVTKEVEDIKQPDLISNDDLDKMIDLFKKPDYGFKHEDGKPKENNDKNYGDTKPSRGR